MVLLLAVQVQPASMQDPTGAEPVLAEAVAKAPTLRLLCGDGRYGGQMGSTAATAPGLRVEVVAKSSEQKGVVVLPHRWVVERTFGWLGKSRRPAGRDFETNPRNSETLDSHLLEQLNGETTSQNENSKISKSNYPSPSKSLRQPKFLLSITCICDNIPV
ncbi:MAG: hypothetical protein H7Z21_18535 [Hymenobacter sp.]|nr:hypothetical protein [Hymenobacter sp.]